jgi:hypothetical protein
VLNESEHPTAILSIGKQSEVKGVHPQVAGNARSRFPVQSLTAGQVNRSRTPGREGVVSAVPEKRGAPSDSTVFLTLEPHTNDVANIRTRRVERLIVKPG